MHTTHPDRRPRRRSLAGPVLLTLAAVLVASVPGTASAAPADASLTVGSTVSLESVNYPGRYIRDAAAKGVIDPVGESGSAADRADASFVVRAGLADSAGVSLESVSNPGHFLEAAGSQSTQLVFAPADGSAAFAQHATFRPVAGLIGQGTTFELWNQSAVYVRHYSFRLYGQAIDGSTLAKNDSSFLVRQGLSTRTSTSPSTSPAPSATTSSSAPSSAPASASTTATATGLTPLADCSTANSDGTTTVVLGYTNSGSTTVTVPVGARNTFSTVSYNSSLPTSFTPGTTHGAASVVVARADANGRLTWTLAGTTLDVTTNVPTCTTSQLPMLASGGALLAAFALAGVAGYVALRRSPRRVAGAGARSAVPGA